MSPITSTSRLYGRIVSLVLGLSVVAGCGAGPVQLGQRSAEDIAVQAADVSGLTRCAQSGSPDDVGKALRSAGDTAGAERLASSWTDAKASGGQSANFVGYTASPSDCLEIMSSQTDVSNVQGMWVASYVIVFSTDSQAQAAWKAGIYGGTPDQFRGFGGTVGNTTGLGDNSETINTPSSGWTAIWTKGSSYSALATNFGPLTAQQLASKVNQRM
jgi:hypothetical protein